MQLTLHAGYAVRALIYLGLHRDRLVPTAEISKAYGISANHLVKVMVGLSEHGYVKSVRGRQGGNRLRMEPEDIRIGDVIEDLEPNFKLVECFDHQTNSCPISEVCVLTSALGEAKQAFIDTLNRHTLSEVIAPIPQDFFLEAVPS